MSAPIIPPGYVNVPVAVVYSDCPPAVRDTYIQLKGLAWRSGGKETPPVSMREIMQITGKAQSTLYEHMRALGSRSWLLFRSAGAATYIISFPDLVSENSEMMISRNLEMPNTSSSSINQSLNIGQEIKELHSEKLEKDDAAKMLLRNPAVSLYRGVTHITANVIQREKIAAEVKDLAAWEACIKHWMGHGWSKMNVTGMLDSYKKGGKAGCSLCNRNAAQGKKPAMSAGDRIRALAE